MFFIILPCSTDDKEYCSIMEHLIFFTVWIDFLVLHRSSWCFWLNIMYIYLTSFFFCLMYFFVQISVISLFTSFNTKTTCTNKYEFPKTRTGSARQARSCLSQLEQIVFCNNCRVGRHGFHNQNSLLSSVLIFINHSLSAYIFLPFIFSYFIFLLVPFLKFSSSGFFCFFKVWSNLLY